MGVLPSCAESPGALTPSALRLPTDGLEHWGLLFQAQGPLSPDRGGRPRRPGPFAPDTSGLGVARLGNGTLPPVCTGGLCRGTQAQRLHHCAWAVKPGPVAPCRSPGPRDRARHPTPGREGSDAGGQTPGLDGLVQCLGAPLEAVGMLLNRAAVFLQNDVRRWGRPPHRREPPQVDRAPMGPAHLTKLGSEPKGFEAQRSVFTRAEGVFTRAGEIAQGFSVDRGDRDRGEGPRAGPARQL